MRKRGSLSLSVNAIVILVLALTMLGLGIAFMRTMFGQLEATIGTVTPDQLTNPPTRDNPLTVAPSELNLRMGDKPKRITVAFMNTLEREYDFSLELSGTVSTTGWVQYITESVKIGRDSINAWSIVVDPTTSAGAPPGTNIIRVKLKANTDTGQYEQTKDIAIKISP